MRKGSLIMMAGVVVVVGLFGQGVLGAKEGGDHPGVIRGVVVDAETGEAIEGVYVGVGEFGDSGGSNRSRHREEGLFARGQTNSAGKFELDGLVLTEGHGYLKGHPLVVTHDDYVRADVEVALSAKKCEVDVEVKLHRGAKLDVTVVDSKGNPIDGWWILRMEDLSGRRFLSPGQDPHMGAFASSVWTKNPELRMGKNMGRSRGFVFNTLEAGEYRVEAIGLRMRANPTPAAIWEQPWRYHGEIGKAVIKAGEVKKVAVEPKEYGTSLTIKTPAEPFAELIKLEKKPKDFLKDQQIRGILNISRNVGLRAWDMGRVYHVEDDRLGRIQREGMFYTMVEPGESFSIENLAPGKYTVLSMVNVKVVIAISSATVDVVAGRDVEVEMSVPVIEGTSEVGTGMLDGRVKLAEREYTVKELCRIVSEATESSPELVPDAVIENEMVRIGGGEIVMWDLVERLCVQKGLKLRDMGTKKLGIGK